MRALRMVVTQNSANYRKEETVENKLTYPLPPPSTVIGAIHNACGYTDTHYMNLSIQGKFESMHREAYTDYCFLNNIMDDRGILVKMKSPFLLSGAFDKVAAAKKSQGNSFRNGITIQVYREDLLEEYRTLKNKNDAFTQLKKEKIEPFNDRIRLRKQHLAQKKKELTKEDPHYQRVVLREQEIKKWEKKIEKYLKAYEDKYIKQPLSCFRTLTTSLKFYEVLDHVTLVIHIVPDIAREENETLLEDILSHIYDLKSIGRSEDFVEIQEAKIVELSQSEDCDIVSPYSAYIAMNAIRKGSVFMNKNRNGNVLSGTRYYLNKNYQIVDHVRQFEKVEALYISQYGIDETSHNIYIDAENDKNYIVNLL